MAMSSTSAPQPWDSTPARYTRAETRQFAFDGGTSTYFGTAVFALLITVFTLAICYPYALVLRERWRAKYIYIEGRQLVFNGSASGLFGLWLKWLLLIIITFYGFGSDRVSIAGSGSTPSGRNRFLWLGQKRVAKKTGSLMRKQYIIYLASAALVLGLTACGSSGNSHSKPPSPTHSAAMPAAPTSSASSPSCNDQMIVWRGTGLSELSTVGSTVSQLGSDGTALATAMSSGGDVTTAEANMQADAAKLQSAVQAAQADLPPSCIPGFRSAISAGLSDYNTDAIDSSNSASAAAGGSYGLATDDINDANTAVTEGNSEFKSATAILDKFEGTS